MVDPLKLVLTVTVQFQLFWRGQLARGYSDSLDPGEVPQLYRVVLD